MSGSFQSFAVTNSAAVDHLVDVSLCPCARTQDKFLEVKLLGQTKGILKF